MTSPNKPMVSTLDQTGVMQVNGAWATSVRYKADVVGPRAGTVDIRFMQGRAQIARVTLDSDKIAETLGKENSAAIARHVASDADKYLPSVRGELRGSRLHYGEVMLPGAVTETRGNSIGVARDRDLKPDSQPVDQPSPHSDRTDSRTRLDGSPEAPATPQAKGSRNAVPEHIASKYLRKDDRYYFDDQTVAFVDKGSHLTVQTHNAAVIKDLIQIAQARDWLQVDVTGTKAFRREAWREAHAAGLIVTGYTPSGIELAAANRDRERRAGLSERVEAGPERPVAPLDSAPAFFSASGTPRADIKPSRGIVFGTLVDHGVAPYQNDAAKRSSYFVTLKDEVGVERTQWGVGSREAIQSAESTPAIGDHVGIERVGATPVTLIARAAGADGERVAAPIDTKRFSWRIEKEQFLKGQSDANKQARTPKPVEPSRATVSARNPAPNRALTREEGAAAAIRSAETTREELQLKYPELNKAVFRHLASHQQFADVYVKAGLIREADRAQVIAQMRERLAGQVEQGKPVREPNASQVTTLIQRSVHRAAAEIGRPAVEVGAPAAPQISPPKELAREDVQVRA